MVVTYAMEQLIRSFNAEFGQALGKYTEADVIEILLPIVRDWLDGQGIEHEE